MSRTLCNSLMLVALSASLGGCGLTQSVSDTTSSTASAIFYKQVKTLHLDFSARASLNTEDAQMNALSVPIMVRIYQLRSEKAVERADYDKLISNDEGALIGDLLDKQSVVVNPEQGATLSVPLDADAKFVAVVGLFRNPDTQKNTWRLTLTRDDLDPDLARVIELGDNQLKLRPLVKE
ncbi:type VI secretion system lipoprotein TssJ [Pseudomonas folii]|jgi:type VI secretion system protein VasD|uniref:Type VI secretion system lipoprotein TssJ n=1 Tax=Pseudomonas folii TaxID=2762593 RepID=A0ABR7AUR6_9PSED|nr:type VI secretion system lipoprotein TssJ [Pseudomonas folii]MBC3948664.1 type VI secretion system lipoprotein TssJ [Pseudomonas folii]